MFLRFSYDVMILLRCSCDVLTTFLRGSYDFLMTLLRRSCDCLTNINKHSDGHNKIIIKGTVNNMIITIIGIICMDGGGAARTTQGNHTTGKLTNNPTAHQTRPNNNQVVEHGSPCTPRRLQYAACARKCLYITK